LNCSLAGADTSHLDPEEELAWRAHVQAHKQPAAQVAVYLPFVIGLATVAAAWGHAGVHAIGFGLAVSSLMALLSWRRLELHCDLIGADVAGVVGMARMIDRVSDEAIPHPGSTLEWAAGYHPPIELRLFHLYGASPPEARQQINLDLAEANRHRAAEAYVLTFFGSGALLGLFIAPTSPWLAWPLWAMAVGGPVGLHRFGQRWIELTMGQAAIELRARLAEIDREI